MTAPWYKRAPWFVWQLFAVAVTWQLLLLQWQVQRYNWGVALFNLAIGVVFIPLVCAGLTNRRRGALWFLLALNSIGGVMWFIGLATGGRVWLSYQPYEGRLSIPVTALYVLILLSPDSRRWFHKGAHQINSTDLDTELVSRR